MLRTPICALLIISTCFVQDQQLKSGQPQAFRYAESAQQTPAIDPNPAATKPVKTKVARRSNKGRWIAVAVLTGVAVTVLLVANKRLSNEGSGIFK